jgi:pheromone shutdown protein TraB
LQSKREIEKAFLEYEPDMVAVELDARRLQALEERKTGKEQRPPLSLIKQIGVTGYMFAIIGRVVQKRLGNIVDVEPGVDQLTAVQLARKNEKALYLIDQDIMITMRRLSDHLRSRMLRMCWDITSPFSKRFVALNKVPDQKSSRCF